MTSLNDFRGAMERQPDDVTGMQAQADLLQEQGDPRGLLLAAACATDVSAEHGTLSLDQSGLRLACQRIMRGDVPLDPEHLEATLQLQYAKQAELLTSLKLLQEDADGNHFITAIDGKKYPIPEFDDVLKRMPITRGHGCPETPVCPIRQYPGRHKVPIPCGENRSINANTGSPKVRIDSNKKKMFNRLLKLEIKHILGYTGEMAERTQKITQAEAPTIRILKGAEAKDVLTVDAIRDGVRNLVNTTFNAPKLHAGMGRAQARAILDRYGYGRTIRASGWVQPGDSDGTDGLEEYDADVFEEELRAERADYEEYAFNNMQRIKEEGQSVAALVDGEVAGMAGYQYVGEAEGKPVYELMRVSVHEKHRNQGIFARLMEQAMSEIRGKHPEAIVLVHSKTPRVIRWSQENGLKPVSFDRYVDLHAGWTDPPDSLRQIWEEHGWRYFEGSVPAAA